MKSGIQGKIERVCRMNFKSLNSATNAMSLVSYLGPLDGSESSVASLVGIAVNAVPLGYTGTAYTSGDRVPGFSSYSAGTELYVYNATWARYADLPTNTWTRPLGTVDHQGYLRLNFGAVVKKS